MNIEEREKLSYELYRDYRMGVISVKDYFSKLDELKIDDPTYDNMNYAKKNHLDFNADDPTFIFKIIVSFLKEEIMYDRVKQVLKYSYLGSNPNRYSDRYQGKVSNAHGLLVSFINYCGSNSDQVLYSKKELQDLVVKSKVYQDCYEYYDKLISGVITPSEYMKFIDKMEMDLHSVRRIIVEYASKVKNFGEPKLKSNDASFVYNQFMKFINMEITYEELIKTTASFREGLNGEVHGYVNSFIFEFRWYAKKNYGIDDLRMYILKSKLYVESYNKFREFALSASGISLEEFYNSMSHTGLSADSYKSIIFDYGEHVLGFHPNEIRDMVIKNTKHKDVLERVDASRSKREILVILTEYANYKSNGLKKGNSTLNILKGYVKDYVTFKYGNAISKEKYDKICNLLLTKINDVIDYYENMREIKSEAQIEADKKRRLNVTKEEAISLINEYISSGKTIQSFIDQKRITRGYFDKAVEVIDELDHDLFVKFNEYIMGKQSQKYAILVSVVSKVIDMMKNGVTVDENNKRDFDALDYYTYSHLDSENFIKILSSFGSVEDIKVARTFFKKNQTMSLNQIQSIRNTVITIKDRGVLTDEEKDIIIGYLKSINAPYSTKLFDLALSRYLKNELIPSEEETNKRKK